MKHLGLPRTHILVGKKVAICPARIATGVAMMLVCGLERLAHMPAHPFGGSAPWTRSHAPVVGLIVENGEKKIGHVFSTRILNISSGNFFKD